MTTQDHKQEAEPDILNPRDSLELSREQFIEKSMAEIVKRMEVLGLPKDERYLSIAGEAIIKAYDRGVDDGRQYEADYPGEWES